MIYMADTKMVIAQNLKNLMAHRQITQMELGKRAGVTQSTIGRLLRAEVAASTDTLDAVAKFFDLEAWQMCIPNLDPANPPLIATISENERRFYESIKKAAKQLSELQ